MKILDQLMIHDGCLYIFDQESMMENFFKLTKVDKSWQKLTKVDKSWQKLTKVYRNWSWIFQKVTREFIEE